MDTSCSLKLSSSFSCSRNFMGCVLHSVDITNEEKFTKLVETECKGKRNILFVESCSNPDGYILGHEMIALLRSYSSTSIVVMDNTWLSAAIFNPFAPPFQADIVVNSLTKYYSCGTAIGGAILLRKTDSEQLAVISTAIERWIKMNGLHTSPHNAEQICKQLDTLSARVKQSSALTSSLLLSELKDIQLLHPLLPSHPSYSLAKKYWKGDCLPSVFTFAVPRPHRGMVKFLEKQKFIDYKTSFGSTKSRIDPFPTEYRANFRLQILHLLLIFIILFIIGEEKQAGKKGGRKAPGCRWKCKVD